LRIRCLRGLTFMQFVGHDVTSTLRTTFANLFRYPQTLPFRP
jgi:hypothetical protein